jgi:hypothetical protein
MMNKRMLLIPVLSGLLLTACGYTRIGRIAAEPYRYANRSVTVNGTVTNSLGALVAGFYQVQDDTGKIYVISNGGNVPPKGSRVSVSGHVTSGLTVGGRSFGTAIRENHHKIRW